MPKIDALTKVNKFKKSDYRPWNFIEQFEKLSPIEQPLETSVTQPLAIQTQNNEQSVSNPLVLESANLKSVRNTSLKPLESPLSNHEQSVSETIINNLDLLTGKERELIIFLFKKCQITASLETPAITTDELRSYLRITAEHLRNIIYRLSNKGKGLLVVTSLKNGRAGWRKFYISNELFQKISLNNSIHNTLAMHEQYVSNTSFKPIAEPIASFSSSSSLKQSTTKEEGRGLLNTIELPLDWQAIDFTSLEFIGFNLNKLQQIYQAQADNFTAEMIQNSLYAFAFDMEVNKIIYKSPINFIMSQLKVKGIPYDFPANYESPRIRAMRLYQERLAAHTQRETELRDNLKRSCFDTWLATVPMEEQNKLIPKGELYTKDGPRRGALFNYFEQNIWPDKEKAILAGMSA